MDSLNLFAIISFHIDVVIVAKTDEELDILVDIVASAIGSLTNPLKLSNAFKSMSQKSLSDKTIKQYLDYLADAFILEKAVRYDVKGKKYIATPAKYYIQSAFEMFSEEKIN